MKKLTLMTFLCLLFYSCSKKSTSPQNGQLQMVVTNLSANTTYSISAQNKSNSNTLLDSANQKANKTFLVNVTSGESILVHYTFSASTGAGTALITYLYQGQNRGAVGASGTGVSTVYIP